MKTTEFRIFDKQENQYCEEPDYRWLLSRKGKLYNSENDEWHELGERYIVKFSTGLNNNKTIDQKAREFSEKVSKGKHFMDLQVGFIEGYNQGFEDGMNAAINI